MIMHLSCKNYSSILKDGWRTWLELTNAAQVPPPPSVPVHAGSIPVMTLISLVINFFKSNAILRAGSVLLIIILFVQIRVIESKMFLWKAKNLKYFIV